MFTETSTQTSKWRLTTSKQRNKKIKVQYQKISQTKYKRKNENDGYFIADTVEVMFLVDVTKGASFLVVSGYKQMSYS